MKLTTSQLIVFVLAFSFLFQACTKVNDSNNPGRFGKGVFITNEGPFQTGTGTISYFDRDSNLVKQDIFEAVNGRPLGNVVQSMSIFNGKGYIVVNNSGKVEVVDASTFKSTATIQGLLLPRYFLGINDKKAYVSDWSGVLRIINLVSNTAGDSIRAGTGPEQLLKSGRYVYVLNGGGFSVDSTVTVIDYLTDKVVSNLRVFDRPTGIVEEASGKIWVMCSGKGFNGWPMAGDTKAHLLRIDPVSLSIDQDIRFDDSSLHPEKLVINEAGNILYFLYNGGIYRLSLTFAGSSPVKLVDHANLYALGFDNTTNYLYASDPLDFQLDGWVIRFRADNGATVDSVRAGIIPGGFFMN